MTTTQLTQRQADVIEKIRALQEHTRLTGFRTTRSVNELKAGLAAEDLAVVCAVLNKDSQPRQ
jgi:hypothetical protein